MDIGKQLFQLIPASADNFGIVFVRSVDAVDKEIAFSGLRNALTVLAPKLGHPERRICLTVSEMPADFSVSTEVLIGPVVAVFSGRTSRASEFKHPEFKTALKTQNSNPTSAS